jgi:nucleotide-binding universal stress UspA family protein
VNYKTLLVHLDDSSRSALRTAVALDLARRLDAHLISLYIVCQELVRRPERVGGMGRQPRGGPRIGRRVAAASACR